MSTDDENQLPDGSRQAAVSTIDPIRIVACTMVGLFVLGVFYTLYFASDFLLPIAAAFLLNLVLAPVVRFLRGRGVPDGLGAAIIVVGLVALAAFSLYKLADPVAHWRDEIPYIAQEVGHQLRVIKEPIETIRKAGEEVAKATEVGSGSTGNEVVVREPGFMETLQSRASTFVYDAVLAIVLLYFLLAAGDMFREKLVLAMPTYHDRRRALQITQRIERNISRYLFTISVINAGLGLTIGLGMWAIGLPNPLLWGIMAAILNFVPFLGLAVGIAVVTLVAVVSLPGNDYVLLAPAIYGAANLVEAQLVTPALLGRRLTMNPVVVFLSLAFWTWIWGPVGTIMAVPILAIAKTICDHFEALAPLSLFLSARSPSRGEPAAFSVARQAP